MQVLSCILGTARFFITINITMIGSLKAASGIHSSSSSIKISNIIALAAAALSGGVSFFAIFDQQRSANNPRSQVIVIAQAWWPITSSMIVTIVQPRTRPRPISRTRAFRRKVHKYLTDILTTGTAADTTPFRIKLKLLSHTVFSGKARLFYKWTNEYSSVIKPRWKLHWHRTVRQSQLLWR